MTKSLPMAVRCKLKYCVVHLMWAGTRPSVRHQTGYVAGVRISVLSPNLRVDHQSLLLVLYELEVDRFADSEKVCRGIRR